MPASVVKGMHNWFHTLRFAGGDVMTFPLNCIGIVINQPVDIKMLASSLPVQPFNGSLKSECKQGEILDEIENMLEARNGIF